MSLTDISSDNRSSSDGQWILRVSDHGSRNGLDQPHSSRLPVFLRPGELNISSLVNISTYSPQTHIHALQHHQWSRKWTLIMTMKINPNNDHENEGSSSRRCSKYKAWWGSFHQLLCPGLFFTTMTETVTGAIYEDHSYQMMNQSLSGGRPAVTWCGVGDCIINIRE